MNLKLNILLLSIMTKIINIVAGPGAGKTTLASGLHYYMKRKGLNVEFLQEYVKKYVILGQLDKLNNQYNVTLKQYQEIKAYEGKVDYVIIDTCLLTQKYFNENNPHNVSNVEKTNELIDKTFKEFDNIVIYLERNQCKDEYQQHGRIQTYNESVKIDKILENILKENNIEPIRTSIRSIDDNSLNELERLIDIIVKQ